MSENKEARERRLNEQCFLLSNLDVFESWATPISYGRLFKVKGGDPVKFVTSLMSRKNLGDIMNLKPIEVSKLVPYIKIYKVFYASEDSPGEEYEMVFENSVQNSTIDAMLTSRAGRGSGVGIKSFEFDLLGGNPVEADRMISAKLVLYFQSMDDLTKSMELKPAVGDGKPRRASYIELIHQQSKFNKQPCGGDDIYNNKYFRIKATVGWAAPPGADESTKLAAKTLDQASSTLFLTMTKHDIAFDDQGSCTLTIDYMAAPEAVMANPKADILSDFGTDAGNIFGLGQETHSRSDLASKRDSLSQAIKSACPEGSTRRDQDAVDAQQDELDQLNDLIAEVDASRYGKFLESLEDMKAIYYVDVPNDQIDAYADTWFFDELASREEQIKQRIKKMREARDSNPEWAQQAQPTPSSPGQFNDVTEKAKDLAQDRKDKDAKREASEDISESAQNEEAGILDQIKDAFAPGDKFPPRNHVRLNYLFLGSVLHLAFTAAGKGTNLNEIRNIVGPFDYRDPLTGGRKNICLADVPISLNFFKMWFFEQCVIPQRSSWALKDFLQNLVATLVQPAMGEDCFGACASGFKSRLNSRIMEVPLTDDKKCRITGTSSVASFGGNSTTALGSLKPKPYPSGSNATGLESGSYLLLYASSVSTNLGPPSKGTRRARDEKDGIYHFVIGADRGLVKKINFRKDDAPYVQSARIANEGPVGVIRGKYNADVDLVGNCMFVPGQLVFIDPGSFSAGGDSGVKGSAANILGIGGYYLVTKAQSALESGKFETKLTCIHQSYGTGKVAKVDQYCRPDKNTGCADDCEVSEEEALTSKKKPEAEVPKTVP